MIDSLASMPARVRALIEGICDAELFGKPAPDVFSLRENVLHLRDIDIEGYEKRVIRILSEEHPFLPDVDGARLAIERHYNAQSIALALEVFATSRAASIARLRGADLNRTAELEGVGEVTLRTLLELWLEHDAGHLADIEALLAGRAARTTAEAA